MANPQFGTNSADYSNLVTALGATSFPLWRAYNQKTGGVPSSYPGSQAGSIPKGACVPVVSIKPALPLSSASQTALATYFASMPKGAWVTLWHEGERDGFTPAVLIAAHTTAKAIFDAHQPGGCKYIQIFTTYTAYSHSKHYPLGQWVCCPANGGALLDAYTFDNYPTTTSNGFKASADPALTALRALVPATGPGSAPMGITECNKTSNSVSGITWTGTDTQWFTDGWAWATGGNANSEVALCFMPFFDNSQNVPYPPTSGAITELKSVWQASTPCGANTVTVTNPGTQGSGTGSPVSLQMSATDSANGQTFTWTATGLPTGLSIGSSNGKITGTPSAAGTYSVKVTATDTTSASGSASFTWTITASPGPITTNLSFIPGGASPGFAVPGNPGGLPPPAAPPSGGQPGSFTIVNQWPLTAQNTYGFQYARVSNTEGNALVAILGLGSTSQSVLPRFNVADDARNFWKYAGTFDITTVPGALRRADVWVAPNADPATFVSVSESFYTSGVAGLIVEVANFPDYAVVDFVAGVSGSGTSAAVSGTATVPDVVIGGLLISGGSGTPGVTDPAGLIALTNVATGSASTDMTNQNLYPAWSTLAAGAFTQTWSWSGTRNYDAILVGFSQNPAPPAQPNPAWPTFQVQAAFGFQPGNLGGAMPVWTDITPLVTDDMGNATFKASRGRPYELTQPEAGTLDLTVDNSVGDFNPLNTASPFYPNVLPETPVRVLATWQGSTYGVASVYANKWPQAYPDPQWGVTPFEGSDGVGMASQIKLPSAYGGEVLIDQPYVYLPLGEFYSPANGMRFSNLSRTNLKPAYGVDDSARSSGFPLSTGMTTGLAGDPASGIGTSAATTQNTQLGGPGAYYHDLNLPALANGFSFGCWFADLAPPGGSAGQVTALTVEGAPDSYGHGARLQLVIGNGTGTGNVQAALYDYSGNLIAGPQTAAGSLQDNLFHHYVVTVSLSGTTWTVLLYVDGVQAASATGTSSAVLDAYLLTLGPAVLRGSVMDMSNYTITQAEVYGFVLDPTRIAAHYAAMKTAYSGDTAVTRFSRLFAWSGTSLPTAATPPSPSPLIGNADQIQGQAISDAAYQLTVDEGGMYYCDGFGNNWYMARTWFYNRTPKFVFGDSPDAFGEIPFDPGAGFDWDDTYLWNLTSSQRTISSGQQVFADSTQVSTVQTNSFGATATEADQASEQQYLPRGPLQQDIETTADQDAYDRANWSLVKYKQPQLRAAQIQLDPASNPASWGAALGVEQGDVVQVNRRPVGAPPYSVICIVQGVQHDVGPSKWITTLTLAPYYPEGAVIQLDNAPFNTPSSGVLAW